MSSPASGSPQVVARFAGLVLHAPKVADVAQVDPETRADSYYVCCPEARGGRIPGYYPPRHRTKPCLHVPYLNFDLEAAGLETSGGGWDGLVRLDRQEVRFEGLLGSGGVDWSAVHASVGAVGDVVPGRDIDATHFAATPPTTQAARVALGSGDFQLANGGSVPEFEFKTHRFGEVVHRARLAREIDWVGELEAATLRVVMTSFDDGTETSLELAPVDGRIRLRVANLCQDGFMGWTEFDDPGVEPEEFDADYCWYYTLFETMPDQTELLPVPYLVSEPGFGGRFSTCAMALATWSA